MMVVVMLALGNLRALQILQLGLPVDQQILLAQLAIDARVQRRDAVVLRIEHARAIGVVRGGLMRGDGLVGESQREVGLLQRQPLLPEGRHVHGPRNGR